MQTFAQQIGNLISEILNVKNVPVQETPPDKAGDYGVPMFPFAKELGKNPAEIAQELVQNLEKNLPSWLSKVEAMGPFVNFFLSENIWTEVVNSALESYFFASENGAGETIVVDYGGENVAKPQSVGHLRSNIIGQAFVNCARKSGYEVIGDNHLGDWGSQFGKLLVAIALTSEDGKMAIENNKTDTTEFSEIIRLNWNKTRDEIRQAVIRNRPSSYDKVPNKEEITKKIETSITKQTIEFLLEQYIKINQKLEEEKNKADSQILINASRIQFRKLSEGDEVLLEIWKEMVEITIANLKTTYDRLGVKFDHYYGESFYRGEKMNQVVDMCEKANLVTKNEDGSWAVIPPEESNIPSFLIRKSDGATLYHTSDLAAINYRLQTWDPARIVYFVAEPQSLHFRQLFWLADKLWDKKTKFEHAVFGMVTLPTGKMSTRKGNTVKLEELLNEARERALKVLEEKQPDLPKNEWTDLAEKIGVGAVIYEDLKRDRTKNITFDWEDAINFEGQSAPYIQYTHARAKSILRKAEAQPQAGLYNNEYELNLLKKFLQASDVMQKVVAEAKPSYLAQWLYDLANDFNKFYANVPVLRSEGEELQSRLALVQATAKLLHDGLDLLGIRAPEQM